MALAILVEAYLAVAASPQGFCLVLCSSLPRIFETLYPWVCNDALCPCQDTGYHLEMSLDNKILYACQIWRGESETSMKYNLHLKHFMFLFVCIVTLTDYYLETLLYTVEYISMVSTSFDTNVRCIVIYCPKLANISKEALSSCKVLHLSFDTSKSRYLAGHILNFQPWRFNIWQPKSFSLFGKPNHE